jgi:hypothetical protein
MWSRIFCRNDQTLMPSQMLAMLESTGLTCSGDFKGDELGWTSGEIRLSDDTPIMLERYLSKEDDIRDDLNSWAAWVETQDFYEGRFVLMERIIQTHQLVTLRKPISVADEVGMEKAFQTLCQAFAKIGDGIYQVDSEGFFSPDGSKILEEY